MVQHSSATAVARHSKTGFEEMKAVRAGLAVLLGLAVYAVGATSDIALADNCKWYGTTALRQQKRNEQLKCGFTGPQWHSNLADHIAWCTRQPPDVWKASARERDQMLAQCEKR